MRKWLPIIAFLFLPSVATAQITLPAAASIADPCSTSQKIVIPINIASATTTQLLALSAGKAIYVCSGLLTIAGSTTTAGSIVFEYGTGATCGTGTTPITGAMAGTTTAGVPFSLVIHGGSGTAFGTIAGQALCALTAGTTVSIQGYITVVQF